LSLPIEVRTPHLEAIQDDTGRIFLHLMERDEIQNIWKSFNDSIEPIHTAGKLGAVLFQFQESFAPSQKSMKHIEWCRENLNPNYKNMIVEFRNRSWLDGKHRESTIQFLKERKISLATIDELESEVHSTNKKDDDKLPVIIEPTCDNFLYIRIHRRLGKEKILSEREIIQWVDRIKNLKERQKGTQSMTVYIMWNTNWENHSVINAKNLEQACNDLQDCDIQVFDWKKQVQQSNLSTGIASFFHAATKRKQIETDTILKENVKICIESNEEMKTTNTSQKSSKKVEISPKKKLKKSTQLETNNKPITSFFHSCKTVE